MSANAIAKATGSVKWSGDNIRTFLIAYKKYEVLWNIHHSNYGNKAKRESIMLKLMDDLIELGVAVPDIVFLRARIKAIKTTYRAELLKISESKTNEMGIYKPKLPWFSTADSFLRDIVIARKSTPHSVKPATSTKDDAMYEETGESENPTVESEQNVDESIEEDSSQPPVVPIFQTNTKKGCPCNAYRIRNVIEKLKKINETCVPNSNKVHTDELEYFGKYIATMLSELPAWNRIICQDKIHSMLIRERLKFFKSPRPSSPAMLSRPSSQAGDSDDDASIQKEIKIEGDYW